MPAAAFEGRVSTTALSPYQAFWPNPYTRYWVAMCKTQAPKRLSKPLILNLLQSHFENLETTPFL